MSVQPAMKRFLSGLAPGRLVIALVDAAASRQATPYAGR